MDNPLVADVDSADTWHTGAQTLDYAFSTYDDLADDDLLGGTLNLVATGLGALGSITDPLGALVAAGVGWVLEHVSFLREFLDWLGGKPDVITSHATTWDNIRQRLEGTAEDMLAVVRADISDWTGDWVDAYRARLADHAAQAKAAATAANGLSWAVSASGLLVTTVRTTVRDIIADTVGKMISKALQAVTVVLIPKAAIEIGLMAARVSTRVMSLISKLLSALNKLGSKINKLKAVFERIKKSSEKWAYRTNLSIIKMRTGYHTASLDAHTFNWESSRLKQFQAAYTALFQAGVGGDYSTTLTDAAAASAKGTAWTVAENAVLNLTTQSQSRSEDGTINGHPL